MKKRRIGLVFALLMLCGCASKYRIDPNSFLLQVHANGNTRTAFKIDCKLHPKAYDLIKSDSVEICQNGLPPMQPGKYTDSLKEIRCITKLGADTTIRISKNTNLDVYLRTNPNYIEWPIIGVGVDLRSIWIQNHGKTGKILIADIDSLKISTR